MGRSQRRKGANAERELVKILEEHGIFAARILEQCRSARLADLETAIGLIEVKRRARAWGDLYDAHEQNDAEIVMHRADGRGWLVSMELDEFIDLLKRAVMDGALKEKTGLW